jgi:hypothetical protein
MFEAQTVNNLAASRPLRANSGRLSKMFHIRKDWNLRPVYLDERLVVSPRNERIAIKATNATETRKMAPDMA